jgi:hypothetical protein
VVWVWTVFAVCTRNPRAAARERGVGAFGPSVVVVIVCSVVVVAAGIIGIKFQLPTGFGLELLFG